ncbi:MAG: DUF4249 family protein [Chloroflexota bacterium]
MKNIAFKLTLAIVALVVIGSLQGCGDDAPNDYQPKVYVEGYLIVDQPLEGIKVTYTQSIRDSFELERAMIKDAQVILKINGEPHTLAYQSGEKPGFALAGAVVLPETTYELEIRTKAGEVVTGKTLTPERIQWTVEPKANIHYPQDTMKLGPVDSLEIGWTRAKGIDFYLISVECLDTLNYGKYLPAPTNEMNRRCYNFNINGEEEMYRYKTTWGFISNSKSPTVWTAFKWFGPQRVTVYAADYNMCQWFVNMYFTGSTATHEKTNSVTGGVGVFGSAALATKDVFLYKNQP